MATPIRRLISARIAAPTSVPPGIVFQISVEVEGPPNQPVDVELDADAEGARQQDTRRGITNPGGEVVVYFDVRAARAGAVRLTARVRIGTAPQVIATCRVTVV
jgi:hypothetical protein